MSETTVQGNIVMNEQLNIAIDRVEKLDDPLLVIGLGGTGADILLTIKRMFAERFTLPRDERQSDSYSPPHGLPGDRL